MARIAFTILLVLIFESLSAQPGDTLSEWTFRFMNTVVQQAHNELIVPYEGIKSLSNSAETQITVRNTWFIGKRIKKNTSIYVNPELAGGSGLSGVAGIAGFPNGEAFRVGSGAPKVYIARAFIRHQIPLSEETEAFENGPNQLRERLAVRRITLTVGKFSLLDYFDGSQYANDGRTQFMNWALMTGGAYDFASDTRGNSVGAVIEYFVPGRIMRFAVVSPSSTPNGPKFDFNFPSSKGINFDVRQNVKLFDRAAVIGFTGFLNNTLGVKFNDIIHTAPDSVAKARTRYHSKYGFVLNIEQEFKKWAWFMIGSWADGKTENWGFTQIDHSVAGGLILFGRNWHRANDRLGIACEMSRLSDDQISFLARGGNGFIIGDGSLRYASEKAFEAYYSVRVHQHIFITFDYQYIWNIAFNADRGNVGVWAIRSHIDF